MPKLARLPYLLPLTFLFGFGCGGGKPSMDYAGEPPPHGGSLTAMPGELGYVEVVKGKAGAPEYSFYFLKDTKTPYSPAPTSALLEVNAKKRVELKAEGDHLVTPTGPVLFPDGDVSGTMTVTLDGKEVRIPFGLR